MPIPSMAPTQPGRVYLFREWKTDYQTKVYGYSDTKKNLHEDKKVLFHKPDNVLNDKPSFLCIKVVGESGRILLMKGL